MNIRMMVSVLPVCLVLVSCGENKARMEQERADWRDYTLMNVFQSDGFSFLPYDEVKDVEGNTVRMDSVFRTPKLVFRFSQTNCDMCIQAEMKHLSKLGLLDHVIGLAGYNNIRMVKLAQKQYRVQFPMYYLPLSSRSVLPEAKEEVGMPYFFYVDQHLRARYLFTPSRQFPDVSRQYLSEIKTLLLGSETEVVVFDSLSADLGKVVKGQTYRVKFTYSNRTRQRLVINDVKTSCGCMVSEWRKAPLEAGQSSELTIKFTPDTPGYNSKILLVSHNLSKHPVRLRITADVVSADR